MKFIQNLLKFWTEVLSPNPEAHYYRYFMHYFPDIVEQY